MLYFAHDCACSSYHRSSKIICCNGLFFIFNVEYLGRVTRFAMYHTFNNNFRVLCQDWSRSNIMYHGNKQCNEGYENIFTLLRSNNGTSLFSAYSKSLRQSSLFIITKFHVCERVLSERYTENKSSDPKHYILNASTIWPIYHY